MSESGVEKTCVICWQSCAGQPRIKNAKGQYAHRACAERKSIKPPAPEPDPIDTEEDDLMGGLLDDLPESEPAVEPGGMQAACPGCGNAISGVVCMSCGFDTRSGKAAKVSVPKEKSKSSGALAGVAASAGGLAAAGTTFLVGSILGAGIGGLVGAGVWAAVVIFTGFEIGYIAIGVGFVTGLGAAVGSRGQTGMMTGAIAVIVTVLAICGGKYFAVKHLTDEYVRDVATWEDSGISDEDRMYSFKYSEADGLLNRAIRDGSVSGSLRQEYELLIQEGEYPDDYPVHIVNEVDARWNSMSADDRNIYFEQQDDYNSAYGYLQRTATDMVRARLEAGGLNSSTRDLYTEALEDRYYPDSFPIEITDAVDDAWYAMTPNDRQAILRKEEESNRSFSFRLGEADKILIQRIDEGILSPDQERHFERLLDEGNFPDEYPMDVVQEAEARWAAMSSAEQDAYIEARNAEIAAAMEEMLGEFAAPDLDDVYAEGFIASFGFLDIVFFLLAILAAYGVGSGGET